VEPVLTRHDSRVTNQPQDQNYLSHSTFHPDDTRSRPVMQNRG